MPHLSQERRLLAQCLLCRRLGDASVRDERGEKAVRGLEISFLHQWTRNETVPEVRTHISAGKSPVENILRLLRRTQGEEKWIIPYAGINA